MSKMHITKSGKTEGQWTSCGARIRCRNGGSHLEPSELKAISSYLSDQTKKEVKPFDVTEKQALDFKALPKTTQRALKQHYADYKETNFDEDVEKQKFIDQEKARAKEVLDRDIHYNLTRIFQKAGLGKKTYKELLGSQFGAKKDTELASDELTRLDTMVEEVLEHKQEVIRSLVNREGDFGDYYAGTDKKHFKDKNSAGSKFTDPSMETIESVLALTALQRKEGLNGDDRDFFISQGASPSAFNPNNRYLKVKTPGTVGIKSTKKMKSSDMVQVVRTKPGAPCSFVANVKRQETTDYAVVVLTKNKDTGKQMVITTFPGMPTKSNKSDEIDALEGQWVTVAKARELNGGDFHVNTRLVS